MIRLIKVALAAFASLMCLFYAAQNLANLQAAYGFVAYVTGMGDHTAYADHFGPAVTSPILVWFMLSVIIVLELLAGLFLGKGAVDLFRARNSTADEFNSAKLYAIAGCGIGVLVWFGLFGALAGAYFQMWQTEAGNRALAGSFWYSMQLGLVWILLALKDD